MKSKRSTGEIRAADANPPARRLESWKRIAQYLNRDVRTVQRWETTEGLPVHRLQHHKQGSVFAFVDELDDWLEARASHVGGSRTPPASRRTAIAGVAVALAVVVAAAVYFSGIASNPRVFGDDKVVLAVLPFENLSGEAERSYFSDGLTEDLITELGPELPVAALGLRPFAEQPGAPRTSHRRGPAGAADGSSIVVRAVRRAVHALGCATL